MARRRADGGSFSFDLIPDDDETSVEIIAAEPPRQSGGSARGLSRVVRSAGSQVRSWPRRRVVGMATVVGVLAAGGLGTAVLTAQARHRAWAQTVETVSGAMLDLGHEPVEAWRIELNRPSPIAVVDGVLIVQEQQPDVDAGEDADGMALRGIDLAAGEIAWSTTVPGAAECTPGVQSPWQFGRQRVLTGAAVVCLSGDQSTVHVVDGRGTLVASRVLADRVQDEPSPTPVAGDPLPIEGGAAHRVLVTPTADLIRIDRIGAPSPRPAIGPLEGGPEGDVRRAATLVEPLVSRDVRVRAEDAATGDVRWETVLDAVDLPAGARIDEGSICLSWQGAGDQVVIDPDAQWWDDTGPRQLTIGMCGLSVVLDLEDGHVIEQTDPFESPSTPWSLMRVPLVDGGWAEVTGDADATAGLSSLRSHVKRADGSTVGEVPGIVYPPLATDGPASALLLAISESAEGLRDGIAAYDVEDASPRWKSEPVPAAGILVRTVDVVVVVGEGRTIVGLDRETGRTLWEYQWPVDENQGDMWFEPIDALTDGSRVAVVVPTSMDYYGGSMSGETLTTALDLATGEVVWTAKGSDPVPFAIAGRLYRFDPVALVALE